MKGKEGAFAYPREAEFALSDDPTQNLVALQREFVPGEGDIYRHMMLAKLAGYHGRLQNSQSARRAFDDAFTKQKIIVRRAGLPAKIVAFYCRGASDATRSRYVDLLELADQQRW
ncbi:MAG: hypothetical protein B0A82_18850, partial [Alkalinema sp. CACIAM 70d]